MYPKTSKIAIILASLFLGSIVLSCNPWRRGSTIKGSNARTNYHTKSASGKRR